MILLQETHITDKVEHDWCSILKVNVSFVTCLPLSAGVDFLLKPGLAAESCLFQEVIKGHFVSLELVINNLKFIIFNISDRKTFFSVVINHLKLFDINQCICIGGDFNCTFEPKLNRNSQEPHPEAHGDFSRFLLMYGA